MSKKRHKIEVELIGPIANYFFHLEEDQITLNRNQDKLEWVDADFAVDGELNIHLACRSKNKKDKTCTLSIKVDGKGPRKYTRSFKKRLAVVNTELELPLSR